MLNPTSYSLRSPEIRPAGLTYGYAPVEEGAAFPSGARHGSALDAIRPGYRASPQDFQPGTDAPAALMARLALLIDPATPHEQYGAIAYAIADRLQCRPELLALLAEPVDPMHHEALQEFSRGEQPVDIVLQHDPYGHAYQLTPAIVLGLLARAPGEYTKQCLRQPVHDALAMHEIQWGQRTAFFSSLKLSDTRRCPRDGKAFERVSRHCISDLSLALLKGLIGRFPPADAGAVAAISPTAAARLLDRGVLRCAQMLHSAPSVDIIASRDDVTGDIGALYWLDRQVRELRHFAVCVHSAPDARVEALRAECADAIETFARGRLRQLRDAGGRKYLASLSMGDCQRYPAIAAYLVDQEGAGGGRVERLKNRFFHS